MMSNDDNDVMFMCLRLMYERTSLFALLLTRRVEMEKVRGIPDQRDPRLV